MCPWFQNVCNFMLTGPYTRAIKDKPELGQGMLERHLLALPSSASKKADTIHWFLFADDSEMKWELLELYYGDILKSQRLPKSFVENFGFRFHTLSVFYMMLSINACILFAFPYSAWMESICSTVSLEIHPYYIYIIG